MLDVQVWQAVRDSLEGKGWEILEGSAISWVVRQGGVIAFCVILREGEGWPSARDRQRCRRAAVKWLATHPRVAVKAGDRLRFDVFAVRADGDVSRVCDAF
jgi:Holliday junction resolvase-like predicted endonuclease